MEPGRLLASGRDADIFEFGPGLVLRRARDGRSIEYEARAMAHAAAHGFPVPEIHEVRAVGREIVMERIDGPSLVGWMTPKPWRMLRAIDVLVELHDALHEIAGPGWLLQLPDGGDRLVHLDLHPLNVIMRDDEPVLIDWANAARGRAETDIAQSWLIMESSDLSDLGAVRAAFLGSFRAGLVRRFLRRIDRAAVVPYLGPVADARRSDRNVRPAEVARMARIVEREERRRQRGR